MKTLFNLKSILLGLCLVVGSITGYTQKFDWAKDMGGTGSDLAYAVAVDDMGNVFVTGSFSSKPADFNSGGSGGTITNGGQNSIFLAKYDAGGKFLWAKSFGGVGFNYGYGIATDRTGNVYITGSYAYVAADFNPGGSGGSLPNLGSNDAFLAKYDGNGKFLWAKGMGGGSDDYGYGVAVDDNTGNVYVTGYFGSSGAKFNPGGTTGILTPVGFNDVFLAKYDSSGNYLWVKNMGGTGGDEGHGIAIDGTGNVYVTGYFYSATADFNLGGGGGTLTNVYTAGGDVFIAKYNPNGNFLWAKSMGGPGNDFGYSIAVDGMGNAYATGRFQSPTMDFNIGGSGGKHTNAGDWDAFLVKFDANGNYMWSKNMAGSGTDQGEGVAVDSWGNVYMIGDFDSQPADFNPGGSGGVLTTAGYNDVFLAKYDPSGNYLWGKSMGGDDAERGAGVAVDNADNVYGTGINGSLSIDLNPGGSGGMITSLGPVDVFLFKLTCDTSSSSLTVSTCEESYTFKDSVYTTNGIYTQVFPNASGCDSTVTLHLTFTPINEPIIKVNGFVLSVAGPYATYQWIKNGVPVAGATSSTYTVTENADYRVAVTNEAGCADTSASYTVDNYTGVKNIRQLADQISVYPNPSDDWIYIQSPVHVDAALVGIEGKTIYKVKDAHKLSVKNLATGIYLLRIEDKDGTLIKMEKIVKQ